MFVLASLLNFLVFANILYAEELIDNEGIKHIWDSTWPSAAHPLECYQFSRLPQTFCPSESHLKQAVNNTAPGFIYWPGKCQPDGIHESCYGVVDGSVYNMVAVNYRRKMRLETIRKKTIDVREYSFLNARSVFVSDAFEREDTAFGADVVQRKPPSRLCFWTSGAPPELLG